MTEKNKVILVTGGAGYMGSHACKALMKGGYTPVAIDNLSRGRKELVKWGPLETGDLLDSVWLNHVFKKYRPAAVLHFAGYTSQQESLQHPALYYMNNVQGTLMLLATMIAHEVRQFVFSSSCAVYGHPEYLPVREEEPCVPVTPYGRTKVMIEEMIADFATGYGMRYAALRYSSAAGADLEGEAGEWHEREANILPRAVRAAMTGTPFHVYGADYETPDGTQVHDYLHVTDLANAHVQALYYLEEMGASCTLNLGTGKGISVREMVAAVEHISGKPITMEVKPRNPGEPAAIVVNSARARELLGFKPMYSELDTMVASALQWHAKHPVEKAA